MSKGRKKNAKRKGKFKLEVTRTVKGIDKAIARLGKLEQEVKVDEMHKKLKKSGF